MADLLIKHLKIKAGEHSALEMLVNQWGFDEHLIPKALQTIGSLFPHYSRHDESHSKQILINIERLLGNENISKLTATDTWLLLESAYWHDIGMVVPQKDIEDAFIQPEFQRYITQIRNMPNHSLHKFCLSFDAQDINKCFGGADTPIDAMDKLRQLMAEWFRLQHTDRANRIIQAPWESVGISSPRTELIPARLFKLLGRICHMHGLPFENIIDPNGLPYREAGLAQEDCHPRFIACLLRMGDLLDLDDNRFCPVMQRIAGDNRPEMSKAHEDKHAGMRHLRVDRERIEISAECESIDAYLETFKWFGWLKQEMHNQMAHWQDIVPSREFGLLPTLGEIHVKLKGEQQLLSEGKKPQFTLDSEQAITLLQGDKLYDSKFACIRELLQNAVDATLLQLWITKRTNNNEWTSPLSEIPSEAFKNTPVTIMLIEDKNRDVPDNKTAWNLKITDQGTGISKDDLSYMLNIGGSRKNTFRQDKIAEMPEWMKPSGTFGLGFQSVFMICDQVKLTTKNVFSNEIIEIIMHDPKGSKEGLVTIKALDEDISKSYGTTLEIFFLLDKKSSKWSLGRDNNESMSEKLVANYDPMLDESFPFEVTRLVEKIEEFSEYSMLPIHGSFDIDGSSYSFDEYFKRKSKEWKFVETEGYQLLLQYNHCFNCNYKKYSVTYRGQPFEQKLNFLDNIVVRIDILSGKAGSWLSINRDKLLESATDNLEEMTLKALEKQIKDDLNYSGFIDNLSSEEKMHFSYFLQQMALSGVGGSWGELAKKLGNAWYKLSFGNDVAVTYDSLSKKDHFTISSDVDKRRAEYTSEKIFEEKSCDLLISHEFGYRVEYEIRFLIIKEWLNVTGNSVKVLESSHYNKKIKRLRYKLSTKNQSFYTKKALVTSLIQVTERGRYNIRYLLEPKAEKWKKLYLKKKSSIPNVRFLFEIPRNNRNYVLLPFLFLYTSNQDGLLVSSKPRQLKRLAKWILPYLEDTSISEKEVVQEYKELINYIDNKIMKPSPFWEEWKKARGL